MSRILAPYCAGSNRRGAACPRGATVPADAPVWCRRHDPDAVRQSAPTGPPLGHAVPLYAEPTDRAEWLAARLAAGTIGASEVARILYGDRLVYALERRGEAERACLDDVREVQRGNDAEPHILAAVGATKPGWVYRHPRVPCLSATPDGVTADGGIVEGKYTAGWNKDRVRLLADYGPMAVRGYAPFSWWVQAQVHHAVIGMPVELAVMVGAESLVDCLAGRGPVDGSIVRIPVERDDAMVEVIEREVAAFHARFVVGGELPEPGPTDEDLRAAMRDASGRWLVDAGVVVEAPELAEAVDVFVREGAARKVADRLESDAKNKLKAALLTSRAAVLRVGAWEVRADARGALKVSERRDG